MLWLRQHAVVATPDLTSKQLPFLEASPTVGLVFTP
jgi:hypothetical protein